MAAALPPCGLTQQKLDEKKWIDADGLCTAKYGSKRPDGTYAVCGEPYANHSSSNAASSSSSSSTAIFPSIVCNGGVVDGTCSKACRRFSQDPDEDAADGICKCGHQDYHHIEFQSPRPKEKTTAQLSRDQGSFRKKVFKREYNTEDDKSVKNVQCQLCSNPAPKNFAAHFVDLELRPVFEEKRKQGNLSAKGSFPFSINDVSNGFIICANCHIYFDAKERLIRVQGDGSVIIDPSLRGSDQYRNIPKKVPWAKKIGTPGYPTKEFLDWANTMPKKDYSSVLVKSPRAGKSPKDDSAKKSAKKRSAPSLPSVDAPTCRYCGAELVATGLSRSDGKNEYSCDTCRTSKVDRYRKEWH